jgi:hypothetical protein
VTQNDDDWLLPQRRPVTKAMLDRAIRAEEDAAAWEH